MWWFLRWAACKESMSLESSRKGMAAWIWEKMSLMMTDKTRDNYVKVYGAV